MASIFLSYSREDRGCAETLALALEQSGHEVWWDRHIVSGREFGPEIEAALDKADLILVAWSKNAGKSPWVRDEAGIGRDSGRLFPILIDRSQPPIGFRQFQSLDLAGWKGGEKDPRTAELRGAVEARLRGTAPAPKRRRKALDWWRPPLWAPAAALLLLVVLVAGVLILRPGRATAEPASLAVLPFRNLSSGDPYFAEGVAEEILNQLAREPQFKVAGRTSSALFKDAADMRDVGRRLHVAYVLEGSVRSAGNQVRVDVALVDARKGMRLWSQNFRGNLNDIFAIQENIGQQVAAHLKRQLVAQSGPVDHLTTSGQVYSLYVTARSLMHQREPSKIDAAIALLKRAVKLDPNYAPAWARLALALNLWEFYGNGGTSTKAERIRYAERAIALAPQLADAHAVLGLLLSSDENLDAANIHRGRDELEKAVSLNPNDAESWYWLYAVRNNELNFDEALDALRRSARIDPFFFLIGEHLPRVAADTGHRDEAIRFLNDRIANHPDPFIREIAQVDLANLRGDRSGAYEHAKKARKIALPEVRSIAENRMGSILLELRLLDQAERFVPPPIVDTRRGKLSFPKSLREAFPRGLDFWQTMMDGPHLVPRLLVKLGRSADIVAFYDEAFSSPDNMA